MTENPSQGLATCLNCGAQFLAGAGSCPVCGQPTTATQAPSWISTAAPIPPTAPSTADATPPIPAPENSQPQGYGQSQGYSQPQGFPGYPAGYAYAPSPARRNKTPVSVGLSLIGLVAILLVGALVVYSVGGSHPGSSSVPIDTGSPLASGIFSPSVHTPNDVPSSGRTLGNPNASVRLDVWEDYQCPPCGYFAHEVMPKLIETYVKPGKVKIVVHYLIVIDVSMGGHESADAANAAMCAADLGKFWVFQDWLFANQGQEASGAFSSLHLLEMGRRAGLDMNKFRPCVEAGTHLAEVTAEDASGWADSIDQAPTVLVNGRQLDSWDYAPIAAAIDTSPAPSSPSPSVSLPTNAPTGTFSPTGSMTTARYAHTATLLTDGRVLIAGGYSGGEVVASAELYDPTTGTFSATGAMTTARYWHTATLLTDGRVLIAGGAYDSSGSSLTSAELYDPTTGTFSATGAMTDARAYHTATLLMNGHVLVAGGGHRSTHLGSTELYDPTTGTFSPTGSMTTARYAHTATLLTDGRVLVAGGWSDGSSGFATAELYDPATGTFSLTGSMALVRWGHTATLFSDGRVLVAGGSGDNSAELYDPKAGNFSLINSMTTTRTYYSATPLTDSRVLIAGGTDGSVALASAELYRP